MAVKKLGEQETKTLKLLMRDREDAERMIAVYDASISEKEQDIEALRGEIKEARAFIASVSIRSLAKRFGVSVTAINTALKS